MATGWPMKVSYANGDVFSASDINDTNGTINLLTTTTLSRAAGKNAVINGGMDIWQRGTTNVTTASVYTADRWQKGTGTHFGVSRQVTGDTTNLPDIQYCARIQRTAASAVTTGMDFSQSFETVNSIPLAGKTVTLSFYARKGANYSATSNTLNAYIYTGTGTDQNILTGFTGSAVGLSLGTTLTSTWQRFTGSATLTSSGTQFAVYILGTPTGVAGANDYYEITGVQVELGSVATTFSRAQGTIQGELAACQRYYWRQTATQIYSNFGNGFGISTTQAMYQIKTPVTLRSNASAAIEYSTLGTYDGTTVTALTNLVVTGSQLSLDFLTVTATVSSGLTNFRPYALLANNSTSGYIGYSAEL